MQLDVQPFAVGETKFFAISSPSPFGKSMVNKPDGTPLGGVAKIWDEKTRKSSEVVTDHLAANHFLQANLAEHKIEWVKPLGAYVVRQSDEANPVVAAVVKYLRENAVSPERKPKKATEDKAPANAEIAKAKAAAQAEMAAILGL